MIEATPGLLPQTLAHSREAFRVAGWYAAQKVVDKVAYSQFRGWADDDSVSACGIAWMNVFKTLRLDPAQCRGAFVSGQDGISTPAALESIQTMKTSCEAATRNGFLARQKGLSPPAMDDVVWLKFQQLAMDRPEPLSAEERTSIDAADSSAPVAVCEGALRLDRNLLAEGRPAFAAFERGLWRFMARDDVVAELQAASRHWPPAPPDFKCPPVGTKIRLSDVGPGGQPVIHTVLGRLDYDCLIVSSISGERGLQFPLYPENPARSRHNYLRALWPLAVGKSAVFTQHPAFGDDIQIEDRVTNFGLHPFAGGQILAFEVTQDFWINGGASRYTMIDYWAPSFGYIIGHRTVVLRGQPPDGNSPNWGVLEVRLPGKSHQL